MFVRTIARLFAYVHCFWHGFVLAHPLAGHGWDERWSPSSVGPSIISPSTGGMSGFSLCRDLGVFNCTRWPVAPIGANTRIVLEFIFIRKVLWDIITLPSHMLLCLDHKLYVYFGKSNFPMFRNVIAKLLFLMRMNLQAKNSELFLFGRGTKEDDTCGC